MFSIATRLSWIYIPVKKNEHTSMRISKIYKKFAVYYNNFLKTPFLINAFLDQRILLVRFHFD